MDFVSLLRGSPLATRAETRQNLDYVQMPRLRRALGCLALSVISLLAWPSLSHAIEKYGRPLPSMDQPDDAAAREAEETLFEGYVLSAAFVHNPTFTARPDNTGLVGLRYMLHLETDLYKQFITFSTDQNCLWGGSN